MHSLRDTETLSQGAGLAPGKKLGAITANGIWGKNSFLKVLSGLWDGQGNILQMHGGGISLVQLLVLIPVLGMRRKFRFSLHSQLL